MLASPIFASTTYAANGTCALNGRRASGTYGYVTEGVATGPNPFVPPGLFPQAGTITLTAQQEDASTLTGTWSVSLAQNDASGPRGAGDKVRTIALTPNLIVSRSTAKKLWAAAADQVARLEPGLQGLQLLNPDRNFACSFHRYCHLLSTPIESIEPRRNPGEDP